MEKMTLASKEAKKEKHHRLRVHKCRRGDRWRDLLTEQPLEASARLDLLPPHAVSALILREDCKALREVRHRIPEIVQAAQLFSASIVNGGRVFYVGAGTSGRMGVIDAAELPPTFGLPPTGKGSAVGVIAGGARALRRSQEGAEDDAEAGRRAIRSAKRGDLVIGISASSMATFVRAALEEAKAGGAATALVTMNRIRKPRFVDVLIAVEVGPEVIAGSTRMKSGLVTKAILHNISTTAMVLAKKIYGNRMVDLQPWCAKLKARSERILCEIGGVEIRRARRLLKESGGNVKAALVMARLGCDRTRAEEILEEVGGDLRSALMRRENQR
ncbi:MAG: N-acetylmuramic acid 6-phosphate etherase [Candidatus Hydrogenedentota bacterium]|nr:MAG: N-acetylmuramic acid 6-phosphate etherase [Candidatus Hydrogenedentota bacterium]